MHAARRFPIALVTAFVLVAVAASSTAEAGGSQTASLVASPPVITAGDTVQLSGAVGEDPSCLGPRTVQLEWRRADSASWAVVASSDTAGDGTFSFTDGPQYSGAYRASLPVVGGCQAAGSDPGAVVFDAVKAATARALDVLIGRASCRERVLCVV